MVRKLLALIVVAAAIWLGARYFAQRGQIRFTLVVPEAGQVRKGDPVVENDQTIGRVTKITHLDGQDAVIIRIERDHRRDVVSDSLFSVENRRIVVSNTFAVGKPIEDGAVLRAKNDRFSRWLAKHADSVKPLIEKAKRVADEKLDSIDSELASAMSKVPDWKRQGKDVLDKNVDAMQKKIAGAEEELKRSDKTAEARKLREKFEKWLQEVRR
jgi:hypothetical protein